MCIDFLTPPTSLITPHRLPAFLECLMQIKNWCSIHARCSKSSLNHSIRFCGIVFRVLNIILLPIVLPHVQIEFLKFTRCDNQALVGCIPIAAVAVHLKLKSWKLFSRLIRCIPITYYTKEVWKHIEGTTYVFWFFKITLSLWWNTICLHINAKKYFLKWSNYEILGSMIT